MRTITIVLFGLLLVGLAGCDDEPSGGPCPAGLASCDGACVSLTADPSNCGSCGFTCGADQRCDMGTCVELCGSGLTACHGSCVDTRNNPDHCGECDNQCAGGEHCEAGSCQGGDCPPGQTECSGECVDLESNPDHCGECGNACDGPCFEGSCSTGCPTGFTDCDGSCVDLEKDEDNCGDCGNACDPGEQCSDGVCTLSCPDGFTDCDGDCVDTGSSFTNCGSCGHACATGEVCDSGSCSTGGCSGTLTNCDGACVDTSVDPANCGGCGTRCPTGEACVSGSCGVLCPGDQVECSGECVDLATDHENCGTCGTACRTDQVCRGRCSCPPGREECSGACIDTRVDPDNCGGCGTACSGSEACVDGACTVSCPAGTTPCSGFCVDTDSDHANCGGCGDACSDSESCVGGVCIAGGGVPGDSCSTAINVTGGGRFTGSTAGASADYSGSCGGVTGRDVVFTYTLTTTSDVFISTFGTDFDTLIYVRSACGGGADLACNDDARDALQSEIRFTDQAPGTYYVILDAWGSGSGDYVFDIYFSDPSSRSGDACGDPEYVDITTETSIGDNTCPWYWIDARDDTRSCRRGSDGLDLVYAIVVNSTSTVTFETCDEASWDTILDLRRVCDDEDASASVTCNDDDCSTQSRISATLEPGIYYLWIDGYSDSACGGFTINITS